jgi:hypothetical protein
MLLLLLYFKSYSGFFKSLIAFVIYTHDLFESQSILFCSCNLLILKKELQKENEAEFHDWTDKNQTVTSSLRKTYRINLPGARDDYENKSKPLPRVPPLLSQTLALDRNLGKFFELSTYSELRVQAH